MHQALYRKWRPNTFNDVHGQDHITSVLKYEVENNKISLAGQNLNTNPIQIIGNLQIEAKDADIDFTQNLEITTNIQINKFDSVTLEESIIPQENLTHTYSYPLTEIAENVNKITVNIYDEDDNPRIINTDEFSKQFNIIVSKNQNGEIISSDIFTKMRELI